MNSMSVGRGAWATGTSQPQKFFPRMRAWSIIQTEIHTINPI